MPTTTAALGLVITAVIIWYLAEWRHCQEQRQPMNLVRNPLALLWLAIQRVWRNRRFVGILICCWIVGVGVNWFILHPLVYGPQRERLREAAAEQGIDLDNPEISSETVVIDPGGIAGKGPKYWLWRSLPRFRPLALHITFSGSWTTDTLALGVLAGVLIALWLRRPKWLPPEVRRHLTWPTYLTLGGFVVMAAHTGFELAAALTRDPFDSSFSAAYSVVYALLPLFSAFAAAVLAAFLWHIILQVGSGRYWNLHNAVTGAINGWLPIAWLAVLLWVPTLTGLPMFLLQGTISEKIVDIAIMASNIGWKLPTVLCIALLFVPWIILAEGASLLPAIRGNLLLIRSHWQDLLVMLPRHLLIVIPVYAGLEALAGPTIRNSAILTSLSFARSLLELVLLVAIVVLYQELRKAEKAEPERQEVG